MSISLSSLYPTIFPCPSGLWWPAAYLTNRTSSRSGHATRLGAENIRDQAITSSSSSSWPWPSSTSLLSTVSSMSTGPLADLVPTSPSSSLMIALPTTLATTRAPAVVESSTSTLGDAGRHADNVGPRSDHDSVLRAKIEAIIRSKTGRSHARRAYNLDR